MTATAAKSGHGAAVKIGDGATPVEAFNTLPEVNAEIPNVIADVPTEDVTNHDSGGVTQLASTGVKKFPNIPLAGNWLSGNTHHQALRTDAGAGTKRNFKITTPDTVPVNYTFAAYIRNFKVVYPVKEVAKFSCELEITDAVVVS